MKDNHRKFEERFGGRVFVVFSIKKGDKKEIYNQEVIGEIMEEIRNVAEFERRAF